MSCKSLGSLLITLIKLGIYIFEIIKTLYLIKNRFFIFFPFASTTLIYILFNHHINGFILAKVRIFLGPHTSEA